MGKIAELSKAERIALFWAAIIPVCA